MSTFYTNAHIAGDSVCVRGYSDGKRFEEKVEFRPSFYVPSTDDNSEFFSLSGERLEKVSPGSLKNSKEWIKNFSDVEGFRAFGNEMFLYQYLSDTYFKKPVPWDQKTVKVGIIDIEVGGGCEVLEDGSDGKSWWDFRWLRWRNIRFF